MKTIPTRAPRALTVAFIAALAVLLGGCGGGGSESGQGGTQPGATTGQAETASAGNSSQGPDTSQLAQIVLDKVNQDPTRMDSKVTGKLVEFKVTSAKTKVYPGMGAESVVQCAGVVVFTGDVHWSWKDTESKKAGEPAKFECTAEYHNQGSGWQLTPPMGIYPL